MWFFWGGRGREGIGWVWLGGGGEDQVSQGVGTGKVELTWSGGCGCPIDWFLPIPESYGYEWSQMEKTVNPQNDLSLAMLSFWNCVFISKYLRETRLLLNPTLRLALRGNSRHLWHHHVCHLLQTWQAFYSKRRVKLAFVQPSFFVLFYPDYFLYSPFYGQLQA